MIAYSVQSLGGTFSSYRLLLLMTFSNASHTVAYAPYSVSNFCSTKNEACHVSLVSQITGMCVQSIFLSQDPAVLQPPPDAMDIDSDKQPYWTVINAHTYNDGKVRLHSCLLDINNGTRLPIPALPKSSLMQADDSKSKPVHVNYATLHPQGKHLFCNQSDGVVVLYAMRASVQSVQLHVLEMFSLPTSVQSSKVLAATNFAIVLCSDAMLRMVVISMPPENVMEKLMSS